MFQHLHDPFTLQLRARRAIAQRRWRLRAIREEHVRKGRDNHPQVCLRPIPPIALQAFAGVPADIHRQQPAGDGVEAGGENYGVEVVGLSSGGDAGGCEGLYGCGVQVDEGDVREGEEGVEVGFEGDAFGAEGVWFGGGGEEFAEMGVGGKAGVDLFAPVVRISMG